MTAELTCRELSDFVADYLDGELGEEERSVFEAHLAECTDCREYLRGYADAIRLAKDAYQDDSVPPAMPERLVQAILVTRRDSGARRR